MQSFKNIVITGAAGFIGSHVIRLFVNKYPNTHFYNLDKYNSSNAKHRIRDSNLEDFIKKPEVYNEFMLMLLEYVKIYFNKDINNIKIPEKVKYETNDYIENNNFIFDFINFEIKSSGNYKDRVKASDMFEYYNNSNFKQQSINVSDFRDLMKFNNFEIKKIGGIQYYTNMKIL